MTIKQKNTGYKAISIKIQLINPINATGIHCTNNIKSLHFFDLAIIKKGIKGKNITSNPEKVEVRLE